MTCPHWFEYVRALGPTFIAGFVAYIAWRQWRTNHDALREKLFDRRIGVYDQVHNSLAKLLREGFPARGIEWELAEAWRNSKSLFDKDIPDYIDELRNAVIDGQYYSNLAENDDENRSRNLERESEKLRWLSNQFDPLFEIFSKYLKFDR